MNEGITVRFEYRYMRLRASWIEIVRPEVTMKVNCKCWWKVNEVLRLVFSSSRELASFKVLGGKLATINWSKKKKLDY